MNPKSILYCIVVYFCLQIHYIFADSPLTSTYWADKYKEISIIAKKIKKVEAKNQQFDKKEYKFLIDSKNPLAHRLTLINANGWNINNLNNAPKLLELFMKKYKVTTEKEFMKQGDAYDLIVYAYCLAMDKYLDVEKATEFAFEAMNKNKNGENSYALLLAFVLIKTQSYLSRIDLWCDIYKNIQAVRELYQADKLKKDFKDEAAKPIYEYLDLYKDNCK